MNRHTVEHRPLMAGCTGWWEDVDTPRMVKSYLRHTHPCPVPGHH
ncbi:hypothetical protein ACFYE2_00635 [Kocuria sp. CPCC 205300]